MLLCSLMTTCDMTRHSRHEGSTWCDSERRPSLFKYQAEEIVQELEIKVTSRKRLGQEEEDRELEYLLTRMDVVPSYGHAYVVLYAQPANRFPGVAIQLRKPPAHTRYIATIDVLWLSSDIVVCQLLRLLFSGCHPRYPALRLHHLPARRRLCNFLTAAASVELAIVSATSVRRPLIHRRLLPSSSVVQFVTVSLLAAAFAAFQLAATFATSQLATARVLSASQFTAPV